MGLYGLWLLWQRRDPRTAVIVLGGGAAVAAAWFVPEYIGSGDLFRGASRAREPVAGSPGASDNPFLNTFTNSAQALTYATYAGAVAGAGAWRCRRVVAFPAGSRRCTWSSSALLASSGFTGNLRYVALPMALLCVLAAWAGAWIAEQLQGRRRGRSPSPRSRRCRA